MDILAVFISWQFLFLTLSIAASVFVVKRFIEYSILDNPKMPGSRSSKFWTELFLPTLPVFVGLATGFLTAYPYPEGISTVSGRIAFGLVAGLFSTTAYRVIFGLLKDKVSIAQQSEVGTLDGRQVVFQNSDSIAQPLSTNQVQQIIFPQNSTIAVQDDASTVSNKDSGSKQN